MNTTSVYQINRDGTVSFRTEPLFHVLHTPQAQEMGKLIFLADNDFPIGVRIVRHMDKHEGEAFTGRQLAGVLSDLSAKQVQDRLCELRETGWVVRGPVFGTWLRTEQTTGKFSLSGAIDPDVLWTHLEYFFNDRGTKVFTAQDLSVLLDRPSATLGSTLTSLKNHGVIEKVDGGWSVVPAKLFPDIDWSAEAAE